MRTARFPPGRDGRTGVARVRFTGYSFLAVEVEAGRHARMTVTALAESGARVDHFEIKHGK